MANVIALPYIIVTRASKSRKIDSEPFQLLLRARSSSKDTPPSTEERNDCHNVCKICGKSPCACGNITDTDKRSYETLYGALVACTKCGYVPCRCESSSQPKDSEKTSRVGVPSSKPIGPCGRCGYEPCRCFCTSSAILPMRTLTCTKCCCHPCKCMSCKHFSSSSLSNGMVDSYFLLGNNAVFMGKPAKICCKCGCVPCRCLSNVIYEDKKTDKRCNRCGCTPCRCLSRRVISEFGSMVSTSVCLMRPNSSAPCFCNCCRYLSKSPCVNSGDTMTQTAVPCCSHCGGYGPCICEANRGHCCKCGCNPCMCGQRESLVCPKCGQDPCVCGKNKIDGAWSPKRDVGLPALKSVSF